MAKQKSLLQQIVEAKNNVAKFLSGQAKNPNLQKAKSTLLKAATTRINPATTMVLGNKQVQQGVASVGKFLQKTPDTTIKIQPKKKTDAKWVAGRQQIGPLSIPVSSGGAKALPFVSSLPGEAIKSYGRTIERVATPKGRQQLVQGGKDLVTRDIPNIVKDPKNVSNYLNTLSNPAVSSALDASDFIPVLGVGSISLKNILKRGFRKGGKEVAENVAEDTISRLGKVAIRKEYEPSVKQMRGLLSSKEVYLVDEFTDWVGKTGGKSIKNPADPKMLEDIVLMTSEAFGRKAADTWSYKKMADAWSYLFKRLSEGKRVPIGLETEDISKNFAKKGAGLLDQTPRSGIQPQTQLDMPPQTARAIAGETGQIRPIDPNVPSNPSSGSIIPQDGNFPRKPQELNVNRLDLTPEQRANVVSLEGQEIRQKLGDKEIIKIARDAGLDTKTYSIDETAQKIAEQLNVRRNIVSLEKELDNVTDPLQRENILKKIAENSRISRTQGTDVARQLSARRIIANELDTPMQRIFKLLDEAGVNPEVYIKKARAVDFKDPKAVVNFYRDLVPAKFNEWVDVVRYNSMLSSPKTQLVNIGGNLLNTAAVAPIEKTLTGVVDLFSSKLTGKEQTRFAGEGLAYAGGYLKNTKKAVNNLIDVMRGKSAITNLDLARAPVATKGVRGAVAKTLEVPTKLMEAFDQFFMALTEGGEKASMDYIKKRGGKIAGDAGIQAAENARYRLFRQVLGDKSQGSVLQALDFIPKKLMEGRNSKQKIVRTISRFTFPFVSTPTNIAKQGIEYSPAGFLTMFGAKNKTEQFTKALMGTLATAGAATLLGSGRLSWSEPTDPDERAAFRAAGQQPYSVKVGDNWVDYRNLPPVLSFNLALISSLDNSMKNGKTSEETVDKIIKAAASMGQFFADKTYFKQMGDMLSAVKGDPESIGRAISNYPQQVIPFRALGGWLARMFDDTQRKVDYSQDFFNEQMQLLMLNIPGLSQKVNPRLDPQGNPIKSQHRFLNSFSPLNVTTEIKDNLVFLAEQKNAAFLYGYLKGMDKSKANKFYEDLTERRPELATKLGKFKAIDDAGLGLPEYEMVGSGIKDGSRAQMITTQLNELPTKAEKNDYINKLYDLGIMNDDVYDQLLRQKDAGRLKAPVDSQKQEAVVPPQTPEMNAPKPIINADTAPITQSFGAYNPEIEIFSGGVNNGTDIGIEEGTELSLPEGVWEVVDAYDGDDMNDGYGKSILVENRKTGERIRLSHLSDVLVDPGELLKGGNTIGYSGATGNVTGQHLDIEYMNEKGELEDILKSQYAKNL